MKKFHSRKQLREFRKNELSGKRAVPASKLIAIDFRRGGSNAGYGGFKWKFERTKERIVWWQTEATAQSDWIHLLCLLLLGATIALVLITIVTFSIAALILMLEIVRGNPLQLSTFLPGDYWIFIVFSIAVGALMLSPIALNSTNIRFEFNLSQHEILVTENCFPNRRLITTVPFESVIHIQPVASSSHTYSGHIQLRYFAKDGTEVTTTLGSNIPTQFLVEHTECLIPFIGTKVRSLIEMDA